MFRVKNSLLPIAFMFLLALVPAFLSCGGGGGGSGNGGGGVTVPAAPTGLKATAGNAQVALTWNASAGATSYNVQRSTTSGGPYTVVSSPAVTSDTDTGLTNGTTYYYVVSASNSAGESANSPEVSATPNAPPPAPTGLTGFGGNAQVSLTWNASTGATSYNVKRSITSGGPYTTIQSPSTTGYTDSSVANGTTYYYVVSAVNSAGESPNSVQVSATPAAPPTSVAVTVDVLSNRHPISAYVYGGAYPKDAGTITDSGLTVVRWGGNATSTYNWKLRTYNADNDYFFEDFGAGEIGDSDSAQFIQDVKTAGSNPLMTMVMLNWVANSAETPGAPPAGNGHWSYSVAKYGPQCKTDPYNSDAGDGRKSDCTTQLMADPNDAYFPLLDDSNETCPSWATQGCANALNRKDWATALATAFGNAPHFYDMDNEIDIWGGTHVDIHPNPSGYDELRDTYLTEASNLKTWDPAAIRFGPVSCCWWFYWNGANGNDKGAHAGVDFLPWWLNEVFWRDQIAGNRSLDVFDVHAYPDGPSTSGFTQAQLQALATSIYRDYWDPTFVSPSGTIDQSYATQIEPNRTVPFRIPRMRALVNMIYPGTPLAITEWSAAFAGESDFSTALGDADGYGILGRERVYLASRWGAPDPANPNYQALKLFTNYDGAHHGFQTISVSAANTGDPNLFSSYAAVDSTGTLMTLLILNKDPQNSAQVAFTLNNFVPQNYSSYTLSQGAPNQIVAAGSQPWTSTLTFPPYTATLLVISGTSKPPASEWYLNPDTIMVAAGGTVTLTPKLVSGTSTVTLSAPTFDSGISSVTIATPQVTSSQDGSVVITAGNTPGFYRFTITGTDASGVAQKEGGWIVVGNPPATLTKQGGDAQSGAAGTTLPVSLTVTFSPGQSGGSSASNAPILLTTDSGSLSANGTSGSIIIVPTDNSGTAAVTLTLPSSPGTVHVSAEGPYGLGHPAVTFTETAQ
jgi:hypothetical protein